MAFDSNSRTSPPNANSPGLVVIYGDDLGKIYNLDVGAAVIGRSSESDIRVDQESISRNHSKIMNTGKAVVIRDLGSTNGTYVNDVPVEEYVLRDGDLIKVGRTIFKFLGTQNIERAYHEEMHRLVLSNQAVPRVPSIDERATTRTMTMTEPAKGHGDGGSDESV